MHEFIMFLIEKGIEFEKIILCGEDLR